MRLHLLEIWLLVWEPTLLIQQFIPYLKTHTFSGKLDSYSNYSFIIRKSSSIIIGGVFSAIVSHPLHLATIHQHSRLNPTTLRSELYKLFKENTLYKGVSLRIFRPGFLSIIPIESIEFYNCYIDPKEKSE